MFLNSWMQNIKLHMQQSKHWGFQSIAQRLVNTLSKYMHRYKEPQTMPNIIAASFPPGAIIHHPQPQESRVFSPLSERLMVTSAQFIERPPTHFSYWTLTTQLLRSSFLLLLWGGKISPASTGSLDHDDMERCQLLIIPRMHCVTVSPWQTVWWDPVWYTLVTCLSQKTWFQIHSEQDPSLSGTKRLKNVQYFEMSGAFSIYFCPK